MTLPNTTNTRVLKMRINPDGRGYKLHPKDMDIEKHLLNNGGIATVKLAFILSRSTKSLHDQYGRSFYPVED